MEWLNIIVAALTVVGVIIALVRYGAKFETKIALISQDVGHIKSNHLTHIEADMKETKTDMKLIRESQIRMEEQLKKL